MVTDTAQILKETKTTKKKSVHARKKKCNMIPAPAPAPVPRLLRGKLSGRPWCRDADGWECQRVHDAAHG